MKSKIVKVLTAIIVSILNPVVFLTILGPSLIVIAVKLIQNDIFKCVNPNALGEINLIFSNKAMFGFVDYTTQYYTALLVSVFWFRLCCEKGLVSFALSHLQSGKSNATETTEKTGDLHTVVHVLFFALIGLFLVYCIFGGQLAKTEVLQKYLNHTKEIGAWTLPPFNSPITIIRGVVGLHGVSLMFYNKRT